MALFSDGPANTIEELTVFESALLEVASKTGIALDAKIELAQREIALELITFVMRNGSQYLGPNRSLNHVVITDGLRQWHAVQTLAAIYRDAYFQSLNDRYQEKWAQYSRLTKSFKELYFGSGVAVCREPIPCLGNLQVSKTAGASLTERTVLVSANWTRGLYSGQSSKPQAITLLPGETLSVLTSTPPESADGWELFAGNSAESLRKVHSGKLPTGQAWLESLPWPDSEATPRDGQTADLYLLRSPIVGRG